MKTALGFMLLCLYFIVLALKHGPAPAFYLYEIVYFLNPTNRWWGGLIPDLSYSFYIVALMFSLILVRRGAPYNKLRKAPGGRWVLVIFVCFGIATVTAVNPEQHNRFLLFLVNSLATMLAAYMALSTRDRVQWALLFLMLAAAYIGWEAMNVGRNSAGRVEGIGTLETPDSNTIAAAIVPGIAIAVYFFWMGNRWVKLLAVVSGALIANGLVLINSRGAFLGIACSFAFFIGQMLFSKYRKPRQRLIAVVLIIAAAGAAVRLADNTFVERMLTLSEETTVKTEGSGSRRVNFWLASIDVAKDYPLGAGIYGFETLSPLYLSDEKWLDSALGLRSVHSIWFQALTEIGWIGAMAFLALLATLYFKLQTTKRKLGQAGELDHYYMLTALQAGTIGFLVSSSFINMFRVQVLFWLVVFAMAACVTAHQSTPNQPIQSTQDKQRQKPYLGRRSKEE
jgi:O-antigen ligase